METIKAEANAYRVDASKAFAKLYQFPDIGQVLFTIDENEDGNPIITVRFEYEGLDITPEFTFANTESGLEKASQYFEDLTKEKAYKIVANFILPLKGDTDDDQ